MNKRAIAILGAIFLLIVATLVFLILQRRSANKEEADPVVVEETVQEPVEQRRSANKEEEPVVVEDQITQEPIDLPAETKAIKLTDDQIISPVLFYQGDGITYFNRQGELFRNSLQVSGSTVLLANKEKLSLPLKAGISKVLWPQDSDNYIAEINNGLRTTYTVYVNDRGGYVDLPANVTSADWMPTGEQMLYIWLANDKSALYRANADNTNFTKLADIWENDDRIHISPDGKNVLYYRTQSQEPTNNINLVTTDGKTFRSVIKDGFNVGALWAPDSKHFLFGKRDASTEAIGLWMGNIETGEIKFLGVNTTPEKAVWTANSDTVVVAVPKQQGLDSSLTDDTIYSIKISNSDKQTFDPGIQIDAENLFLSLDADRVFFKGMQDGGLYYLNLQ